MDVHRIGKSGDAHFDIRREIWGVQIQKNGKLDVVSMKNLGNKFRVIRRVKEEEIKTSASGSMCNLVG